MESDLLWHLLAGTTFVVLPEPGSSDDHSRYHGRSGRHRALTLTSTLKPAAGQHADLIPVAIRLMWDVDGVVDIVDRLGKGSPPRRQSTVKDVMTAHVMGADVSEGELPAPGQAGRNAARLRCRVLLPAGRRRGGALG